MRIVSCLIEVLPGEFCRSQPSCQLHNAGDRVADAFNGYQDGAKVPESLQIL